MTNTEQARVITLNDTVHPFFLQAASERWDAERPTWEEDSLPREDRRYVDESDVANPDETIVREVAPGHVTLVSYGRNEPDAHYF